MVLLAKKTTWLILHFSNSIPPGCIQQWEGDHPGEAHHPRADADPGLAPVALRHEPQPQRRLRLLLLPTEIFFLKNWNFQQELLLF